MRYQAACAWLLGGLLALAPSPWLWAKPGAVRVRVSVRQAWTDTGVDVPRGAALAIAAEGRASFWRPSLSEAFFGHGVPRAVGPAGTYVWPRRFARAGAAQGRTFPLPAIVHGPHPAFALIGRLGPDGELFYVGERFNGRPPGVGRLWLGVNDDTFRDNHGAFDATLAVGAPPPPPQPAAPRILPGARTGAPVAGARVLLLYVDGLRPDVLRELAQAGFLPNLARAFLDRGVECARAFTGFPTNTLITNASLFTGRFPDATGIKSQHQFHRAEARVRAPWLPRRHRPRILNLLDKYAPQQTHAFLRGRGIPTLASRLGEAFRFTALPVAPLHPPPGWLRRAINTIGPFGLSSRLPSKLDAVNAEYALEELIGDPDARVVAVWFPGVDKTCHFSPRGQFGAARRDLALVDQHVGRLLRRAREVGWADALYLVLLSDHGHEGGRQGVTPPPVRPTEGGRSADTPNVAWGDRTGGGVNRRANLPRDWAHRHLGCNARVVGQEWAHPGLDPDRFVFFDNQGAGQASIFLPFGSCVDGAWRRNGLHELTHYARRPSEPPLNLLASLSEFRGPEWDGRGPRPVDLVLVKLDAHRVLVYRDEETQALIHRQDEGGGRERFRYEPVRGAAQSADGGFTFAPPHPGQDPLGYLMDPAVRAVIEHAGGWGTAHDAQTWLEATADSRYPGAVVGMATFFSWEPALADLAEARDPDLVVTASPGWSFRSDEGFGTDHGSPLAEAARITLWLAGPNLSSGRLEAPHHIVDVMPTLLQMIGWPHDPSEFDGRAIEGIYD